MTDLPTHTSSDHAGAGPRDPEAFAQALSWFTTPGRIRGYVEFARRYSELPHQLFMEVAIALARTPVQSILDIGCDPGSPSLAHLKARLPTARAAVLPRLFEPPTTSRQMTRSAGIVFGVNGLGEMKEKFDLILGYSMLRLCHDPTAVLRDIRRLLTPGGLAYLVDFRRDLAPETREHLLGRLDTEISREFLAAQLDAAFSLSEMRALLNAAEVRSYRLAPGGLAGYPVRSGEAYELLRSNDELARILFRLSDYGFRSAQASDLIFHLFIDYATEDDDAG